MALKATMCLMVLAPAIAAWAQGPSDIALSIAEQTWLERNPVIRVGADPGWPPFSFRDESGQLRGLDIDLTELLISRIGAQIEYITTASWSETEGKLNTGELDLVPGTAEVEGRKLKAVFTEPYLSSPVAIIMREDAPFSTTLAQFEERGLRMAAPRGYASTLYLQREYSQIPLILTETVGDALVTVSDGLADAMVENLGACSYAINKNNLSNLKIVGITSFSFSLRIAVREDAPLLRSILDKALDSTSESERLGMYARWFQIEERPAKDGGGKLWKIVGWTVALAGALVSMLFIWNRQLHKELGKREVVEQALRKSEGKFRRIFESLQDAYFLTDMDGKIQLVNTEAVRLLEIRSQRFIENLNIGSFLHEPGERERLTEAVREREQLRNQEIRFIRADGVALPCDCNVQLVRGPKSEEVAIEYVARVTDREARA